MQISTKLFYFLITFSLISSSNVFAKKLIPFEFFQGNLNQNLSKRSKVYLQIFNVNNNEKKIFKFDSGDFKRYRDFPIKNSSITVKDNAIIKIILSIKTDEIFYNQDYTLIYKEKCNCLSIISSDKLKKRYSLSEIYSRKDTSSFVDKNTFRYINNDQNIMLQLRLLSD